jgi:3-methylcrotonyl-CoA carboxylase alpha subunit
VSGEYLRDGRPVRVTVEPAGGRVRVQIDDHEVLVESVCVDERQVRFVTTDGRHHRIAVARRGRMTFVAMRGASIEIAPSAGSDADEGGKGGFASEIAAPMPGKVLEVLVAPGDDVPGGTPLLRLEAMKMEQTIRAPAAARVREVRVTTGEMVGPGAVLLVLDPAEAVSG